ncbi:carbohydrate porin [Novosphingobium sp.]|uniref:carbohydrate porin n=1 Tax=Novosphingobium sp. TaxID=1874826 RepID=UPI0028AE63EE|nr:carbohydrate porin [Novosphingobium sp.]
MNGDRAEPEAAASAAVPPQIHEALPPPAKAPTPTASASSGEGGATRGILGDWAGIRPALGDIGLTPRAQYIWFPVYNLTGGTESKFRQAGQATFGLTADLKKIAGVAGGSFQLLITKRHGKNLSTEAGIGLLNYAQAIFGAGTNWRLSQMFYRQKFGRFDIKIGRMSMGEDFATGECYFESLYFCGTKPSHTFGGNFYNPPTSVWATRIRINDKLGYTETGVYELNPVNGRKGFYLGFKGRTGVLLPFERGFDVKLGGNPKLAGTYRIGFWYDTSRSNDLVYDVDGGFFSMTGEPRRMYRGRSGIYIVGKQVLRAARADGAGSVQAFFSAVRTDRRTVRVDNLVVGGVIASGLIAGRPKDQLGIGIGRVHPNGRLKKLAIANSLANGTPIPRIGAEYATEINYSISVTQGLSLRPNLQWYINPGGRKDRANSLIAGMGVFAIF